MTLFATVSTVITLYQQQTYHDAQLLKRAKQLIKTLSEIPGQAKLLAYLIKQKRQLSKEKRNKISHYTLDNNQANTLISDPNNYCSLTGEMKTLGTHLISTALDDKGGFIFERAVGDEAEDVEDFLQRMANECDQESGEAPAKRQRTE